MNLARIICLFLHFVSSIISFISHNHAKNSRGLVLTMSNLVSNDMFPVLNDDQFKLFLERDGKIGIAFDIDETLSWTVVYWLQRMQNLFGNPEGMTAEEMAVKYHLAQNVPYWQGRDDVSKWMDQQRTDNEMQKELPLIKGSLETVQEISKCVYVLGYVTVRPQCVLQGTQDWLLAKGFPPAPVIGRPDSVPFDQGNTWKGCLLSSLASYIKVFVDDNPSVMRGLSPNYNGKLLLYSYSESVVPDDRKPFVVACPTWSDISTAIKDLINEGYLPTK